MDPALHLLIFDRVAGEDGPPDTVGDLVLAACDGSEALADALRADGKESRDRSRDRQLALVAEPPRTYLTSIAVRAFRGVGREAVLELEPGPGLTLVVGRNGSGKSSFAEGLELLMTGTNSRWENRTKVWTEGWRNLHSDELPRLAATFVVDGRPGVTTVERRWSDGEDLSRGAVLVKGADGHEGTLAELGWDHALVRFRPFLSYSELGSMFDRPAEVYEALSAVLGLEDVDAVVATLRDVRLDRERAQKAFRARRGELLERLAGVDDDRARAAHAALDAREPDLDALELALEGELEDGDPLGDLHVLRGLCALEMPSDDEVVAARQALADARAQLDAVGGASVERAARLATLLEGALEWHEHAGDGPCPVCGARQALDEDWRARTTEQEAELREEARVLRQAAADHERALRGLAALLPPAPPAVVARAARVGLDAAPVDSAWSSWKDVAGAVANGERDPDDVAPAIQALADAVSTLRTRASDELERRDEAWRPVAREVRDWLPEARDALGAGAVLKDLKAAEAWMRDAAGELRTERLAPIADAARANWQRLRQNSNVELGDIALVRSGNTRSAQFDVRVDETGAPAFGVMSQGELNSLAISVFLPRTGLPESPFRYVVIDDPVQSMDPSKVDGLARILAASAEQRQVLVFTHDDRLPEATRRLGIDARIVEVTRRPGSVVDLRALLDPVERYIADARAVVRTETVPDEVARRVVPGLCRHALEAAAATAARRRRLSRGEPHGDVEALLGRLTTLYMHLALALFDDEARGGDVLGSVNGRFGGRYGTMVKAVNAGAHAGHQGELAEMARDAATLARQLAELP